jgi:hypothetical protein
VQLLPSRQEPLAPFWRVSLRISGCLHGIAIACMRESASLSMDGRTPGRFGEGGKRPLRLPQWISGPFISVAKSPGRLRDGKLVRGVGGSSREEEKGAEGGHSLPG